MKVTGSDPALSGTYRYVKVTPSGEYPAECQDGCTYLKAWLYYIVYIYSYLSGNGEFFGYTLPFGFLPMYKGQR